MNKSLMDKNVREVADQITDETIAQQFIDRNEEKNRHVCLVCGKELVRHKTMFRHVMEKHVADPDFGPQLDAKRAALFVDRIREVEFSNLKMFKDAFDKLKNRLGNFESVKEDFVEKFMVNSVDTLRLRTKSVVIHLAQIEVIEYLVRMHEHIVVKRDNPIEAFAERFLEWHDEKVFGLIKSPPVHNSTCAMQNVIAQFKFEGLCSMFGDFSTMFVMKHTAQRFLSATKYMLDNGIPARESEQGEK